MLVLVVESYGSERTYPRKRNDALLTELPMRVSWLVPCASARSNSTLFTENPRFASPLSSPVPLIGVGFAISIDFCFVSALLWRIFVIFVSSETRGFL